MDLKIVSSLNYPGGLNQIRQALKSRETSPAGRRERQEKLQQKGSWSDWKAERESSYHW